MYNDGTRLLPEGSGTVKPSSGASGWEGWKDFLRVSGVYGEDQNTTLGDERLTLSDAIREFRGNDLIPVRDLIHRTIDARYAGVYPPRAVQFFKEYHSEAKILERSRKGEILVLEREGRAIATGSIAGGEIAGVFVDPEFQRRGIGAAVMRALEKKAAQMGRMEVELSVSLPSRRFYEKLGYAGFEARSIDVGEGQRLEYWQAWKRLTGAGNRI